MVSLFFQPRPGPSRFLRAESRAPLGRRSSTFAASDSVGAKSGQLAQGHGGHVTPPTEPMPWSSAGPASRHPRACQGLKRRAAWMDARDRRRERPTQGLLDVYTLSQRMSPAGPERVWIVDDVLHSRCGWRPRILAFGIGRGDPRLRAADPGPASIGCLGSDVRFSLDDVEEADIVYALQMQNERMRADFVPSLHGTASCLPDERQAAPRPDRSSCTRMRLNSRVESFSTTLTELARGSDQRPGSSGRRRGGRPVLYELLAGAQRPSSGHADASDAGQSERRPRSSHWRSGQLLRRANPGRRSLRVRGRHVLDPPERPRRAGRVLVQEGDRRPGRHRLN